MRTTIKKTVLLLIPCLTAVLITGPVKAAIVATFDDPAADGSTPLFTIDNNANTLSGGWGDSQTNLDLEVFGSMYNDAFFTMSTLNISSNTTNSGTIKFFADGQSTATTPLVQIDFDSGNLSMYGFGGISLLSDNVTITGSLITQPLTNQCFSFSFANHLPVNNDWGNGYTATAAFTSSADIIPEPATIVLLGLGGLAFLKRRQK